MYSMWNQENNVSKKAALLAVHLEGNKYIKNIVIIRRRKKKKHKWIPFDSCLQAPPHPAVRRKDHLTTFQLNVGNDQISSYKISPSRVPDKWSMELNLLLPS